MKTTTVALRLLLLFLMGTGGVSCSTGKPSPPTVGEIPPVGIVTQKGDRQLAIDVNPASNAMAYLNSNYDAEDQHDA